MKLNDLKKSYNALVEMMYKMEKINDDINLLDDIIYQLEETIETISYTDVTRIFINNGTYLLDTIDIINENLSDDISSLIENDFHKNPENYNTYTMENIQEYFKGLENLYNNDIENFINEDFYYIDLGQYINSIERTENIIFSDII